MAYSPRMGKGEPDVVAARTVVADMIAMILGLVIAAALVVSVSNQEWDTAGYGLVYGFGVIAWRVMARM